MDEILKQVPALGVLVWLVLQFLKHIRDEGEANRELREKEIESNKALAEAIDNWKSKIKCMYEVDDQ